MNNTKTWKDLCKPKKEKEDYGEVIVLAVMFTWFVLAVYYS